MIRFFTVICLLAVGISACDSEGIDRAVVPQNDTAVITTTGSSGENSVIDSASETSPQTQPEPQSDISPQNTDNNAQPIAVPPPEDNQDTSTINSGQISDDAGSSTSDGGESVNINTDDVATESDQLSDDASDPEQTNGDAGSTPDTGPIVTEEFASDNVGGAVTRTSTLSLSPQDSICTSLSDQNNFSDMRIGDFILHNNAWRPDRAFPGYEWEQCIFSNTNGALVGWNYDWGPGVPDSSGRPSGDFFVRSYPELIFGVKDEFRTSAPPSVTGLPVELSQLPNITIDYSYNGPEFGEPRVVDASNNARFPNGTTISGERNVAIESFLYNKDAAGQCSEGIVSRTGGSNHTFEIMLWLDAGAERLPAGPSDFVTDLSIRGADYKVYTKGGDPRYIAFVTQNPQTSGTIFWNDFVDWARENAHQVQARFGARSNAVQIQDDWCVANLLVGTEIFWGAGNFEIFDWTITQSQ